MMQKLLSKAVSILVLVFSLEATFAVPSNQPNIVLILADDLGWSDVGYQGADLIETPHIDAFSKKGASFSNAYSMPVCSPTRAALLTGKHAARIPMTIWSEGSRKGPTKRKLLQASSLHSLPHSEVTFAEYFKTQGYLTALIGKWHIGDADHYPETQGFDVNIGGTHWGAPNSFFWPYRGSSRYKELRFVPGLGFGKKGEYLTDRLTDEAVKIIDKAGDNPFFLFLSHHAPHTPVEAKSEDVAYFKSKLKPSMHHQNVTYAAMVKSLDDSVGRVVGHLKKKGLAENTIVIFASDNGGFIGIDRKAGQNSPTTNNYPLRSGKGSCYEGGIRVPLIVNWPGVTSPGSQITEPVLITDIFHSLAAAFEFELPEGFPEDGLDLRPLLKNSQATLGREALFFHYPHYYPTTTPVSAVRAGKWKLLHYYEGERLELFDLEDDPSESKNVAREYPEKAQGLLVKLQKWLKHTEARFPTENPNFKKKQSK